MSAEFRDLAGNRMSFAEKDRVEELAFQLTSYKYADPDLRSRRDACRTYLGPKGRTPVFEVLSAAATLTDTLVKGEAFLVRFQPKTQRVNSRLINAAMPQEDRTVVYEHKEMFAWINVRDKEERVEIEGNNEPPYDPSQERRVPWAELPQSLRERIQALGGKESVLY